MEQEHFVLILAWTLSMSLLCQDFIVVLSYPNIIGEKCILPSTYNVYNDMPLTTWFAQLCDCLENIRKQRPQAGSQFNSICLSKHFAIKLKCYVCSAINEKFPIRFPTEISSFDMRLFFRSFVRRSSRPQLVISWQSTSLYSTDISSESSQLPLVSAEIQREDISIIGKPRTRWQSVCETFTNHIITH